MAKPRKPAKPRAGKPIPQKSETSGQFESALTPDLVTRMGDLFRLGMNQSQVARFHGISTRTLRHWLTVGKRRKKGLEHELVQLAYHQEMVAVRDCLTSIHRAHGANQKWQAAAWFLERKYPHLYADRGPQIREADRQYAQLVKNSAAQTASGTGEAKAGPDQSGDKGAG